MNEDVIPDEEKQKIKNKLSELKEQQNILKAQIYGEALEKAGLDYANGETYPREVLEKYQRELKKAEREKNDLIDQKNKKEDIIEQRKSEMNEQFDIAMEKYKEMFEAGKISQELYEKRILNMKEAKEKDIEMLNNSFADINDNISEMDKKIDNLNDKIEETLGKAKIFSDYDKVYSKLFGESLETFAISRNKSIQESLLENAKNRKNNDFANKKVEDSTDIAVENNEIKKAKVENVGSNKVVDGNKVEAVSQNIDEERVDNSDEKEEHDIIITSKTMFNELYKKLSRGNISDKELTALSNILSDEKNYDKYGITTGLIFNKSRKILKEQGARMFKNIDYFLVGSYDFSKDINFDPEIENENVLSHDLLNYWKDISDDTTVINKEFSVEVYIAQIDKYKNEGNELTEEQERIYKEAMNIKEKITKYKKSVKVNGEVTKQRNSKSFGTSIYNKFKDKFSSKTERILPEAQNIQMSNDTLETNREFDLSSMVQNEVRGEELVSNDAKEKNMDDIQR